MSGKTGAYLYFSVFQGSYSPLVVARCSAACQPGKVLLISSIRKIALVFVKLCCPCPVPTRFLLSKPMSSLGKIRHPLFRVLLQFFMSQTDIYAEIFLSTQLPFSHWGPAPKKPNGRILNSFKRIQSASSSSSPFQSF